MATKMKLPIIVLCILGIILTIGIVFFEHKNNPTVEEFSTEDYSYEDVSEDYSFENVSEWESLPMEETATDSRLNFSNVKPITLEETYHGSKEKTTQVVEGVQAPAVSTTKKAAETVVLDTTKSPNNNKYVNEKEILAKLLYCESGSTSWDCQVYTCSAILNLSDYTGRSISNMASDKKVFSVAPWVWSSTPTQTQYKVIDYVLSGGRVSGVKWFRTDHYHSFGTPVKSIDNVYFSK